jgi:hypothetical protein
LKRSAGLARTNEMESSAAKAEEGTSREQLLCWIEISGKKSVLVLGKKATEARIVEMVRGSLPDESFLQSLIKQQIHQGNDLEQTSN